MQNVETTSIHMLKFKRNSIVCQNVDHLLVAETNSIVQSRVGIRILHTQHLSTANHVSTVHAREYYYYYRTTVHIKCIQQDKHMQTVL